MGLTDSLYVTLKCPQTGQEKEVEVQFKFADPRLNFYRLGDQLPIGPYGNLWIPNDYLCDFCTTSEPVRSGEQAIGRKLIEAVFHSVYIHLEQGKFLEVLTEEEFNERYEKEGERLPPGQMLWIPYYDYQKKERWR